MMRVLHPGGRIVISDPDWATLVIDGPDPKVTRKIVAFICDVQIRTVIWAASCAPCFSA